MSAEDGPLDGGGGQDRGRRDRANGPLPLPPPPPWEEDSSHVKIVVDLPTPTRRSDPPAARREAALSTLQLLPPADITIRSDGSAAGGTVNGGAGAEIHLHRLERKVEVRAAAGSVCSSLRVELMAMREVLAVVAALPPPELRLSRSIRLLTDSRSGLQLLQRGPAGQTLELASDVWRRLQELGDAGASICLQWVPGHADICGNEAADRLANEAASADQTAVYRSTWPAHEVPSDVTRPSWPTSGRGRRTRARLQPRDTMTCRDGSLSPSPN